MNELKQPPFSIEAEQSVLGGVMQHAPALDDVSDIVAEADFYRRDHREIWRAILALDDKGTGIDAVTVCEYLDGKGQLENIGGLSYAGSLVSNVPGIANIKTYARIVADKARERRMLQALEQASAEVWSHGDTDEKLDKAARYISEATEKRGGAGPKRADELLPAWIDALDERHSMGGSIVGLRTGFVDIDHKLAGLQNSDLIVIAGRPSMGKSTLAFNIAQNVALDLGVPVAVFSMEMPSEQILNKLHSARGGINHDAIRSGNMEQDEWQRLTKAMGEIKDAPIYLDDTPALTPHELKARARRLHKREGVGLVVVDYLQLMKVPGYEQNRRGEVEEVSRSLKALAKELRIPVVALSQLSRNLENRPNKRPVMSDLRESGAIEQDADVIAFVYRDEVYNNDSAEKGVAEIKIAKQRNGPTGTVRLVSQLHFSRFENHTQWGE